MTVALEAPCQFLVLEVEGTLRAPVTTELRQRVETLLGLGQRRIVLDLARLSALDAAGIGELVSVYQTAIAAGGVLRIANADRRVDRLLNLTGVSALLSR